jgi:light-regulated signal transduction histidine kinase (bacteriophytochrome)
MDKVRGVMNLGTSKETILDQGKIDLLTATGNEIAVAANNAKLYEDLQNKIMALNEKKEMIEFFTYSISHDLKSPALGIYGLSKRFQDNYEQFLDDKGRMYITQILKAAENIVGLVETINAYIVTKEAPFHFEEIKLKEITDAVRSEFHAKLKERQIRWIESDSLPEMIADRMALLRTFRNFVENSIKYGGEAMRELKIGYEEDETFHILSFSDDGVGIKPGDKEKIFEQFQRNETSRGISGAGLGLAIVKEIAETHEGRAWLDNNPTKGVTFYISISKDLEIEY